MRKCRRRGRGRRQKSRLVALHLQDVGDDSVNLDVADDAYQQGYSFTRVDK